MCDWVRFKFPAIFLLLPLCCWGSRDAALCLALFCLMHSTFLTQMSSSHIGNHTIHLPQLYRFTQVELPELCKTFSDSPCATGMDHGAQGLFLALRERTLKCHSSEGKGAWQSGARE